jgi:hypothetical protein
MTSIGDEIRSEAAIADRPGQMARLDALAARVDRIAEYADAARGYVEELADVSTGSDS